ncbi:MAG TPA: c-type cytochrome [Bryobacteraceae bacterium]|nr:c-type cytochrome [Bryobacteraceae bacterium]
MVYKGAASLALLFFLLPVGAQTKVDAGHQLYRTHCFVCHGEVGESVPGVSFRSGTFRRASTDDEIARLILNGVPGTGMPPTNLTLDDRRNLVAYLRSMHTAGEVAKGTGDAARGLAILQGKGGCLHCHRVDEKGSRVGPDLSEIGLLRDADYLEKSLIDPDSAIAPANRFVRAVTKQGTTINGRRLNEDTHTIQLIDSDEHLVSLDKSDLRQLTLIKQSPMPSYREKLSPSEIADVVSYLLSLKGTQ